MVKIKQIPGIEALTVEKLKRHQIHTLEDLWREMGDDYPAGLAQLGLKTGLEPGKIQQVLARGAHEPEPRLGFNEIALLAAALLLLALLVWRWVAPLVSAPPQVLVAGQNLPAYHVLAEADLASAAKKAPAGSFTQPTQVAGRYLLRPLATGEAITKDLLSEKALDPAALTGQDVLTLPVPAEGLDPSLKPGDPAWLVLSPRDPPEGAPAAAAAGAVEAPAILLKLEKSGEVTLATVAIPKDQHAAIADALGYSLVVLQHR